MRISFLGKGGKQKVIPLHYNLPPMSPTPTSAVAFCPVPIRIGAIRPGCRTSMGRDNPYLMSDLPNLHEGDASAHSYLQRAVRSHTRGRRMRTRDPRQVATSAAVFATTLLCSSAPQVQR